jgi:flagellar protein FliS
MTPQHNNASAYLRTRVFTASPEQLRLMLLDGALKFARQGRDGLSARDFEASYNGFSRCRNIVLELINSMRPEVDPDLCARLSGLYTFIYTQLIEASHAKNVEAVDKVIALIEYERDTWALLIDKLAAEKAGAPALHATPAGPAAEDRPALSVQG